MGAPPVAGSSDLSEWQRSARSESALSGEATAGHRNRKDVKSKYNRLCVTPQSPAVTAPLKGEPFGADCHTGVRTGSQ